MFQSIKDSMNGVKTFGSKAQGYVKEITNIPDSIGKSVQDVMRGDTSTPSGQSSGGIDHRCMINIKPSDLSKMTPQAKQNNGAQSPSGAETVLGQRTDPSNILSPLFATNGVLFPYTPIITTSYKANYESLGFTHSNYSQQAYQRSDVDAINITGSFTAETDEEARYAVAAIHFFRTVSKMYFGNPLEKAGFPPPVLLLNYLGDMYKNVPVVLTNFSPQFDDSNVDLVTVSYPGMQFSIPVSFRINVVLQTQYNPYNIKNEFNLDEFRTGKMLGRGYI